jgi:hypothetical protein
MRPRRERRAAVVGGPRRKVPDPGSDSAGPGPNHRRENVGPRKRTTRPKTNPLIKVLQGPGSRRRGHDTAQHQHQRSPQAKHTPAQLRPIPHAHAPESSEHRPKLNYALIGGRVQAQPSNAPEHDTCHRSDSFAAPHTAEPVLVTSTAAAPSCDHTPLPSPACLPRLPALLGLPVPVRSGLPGSAMLGAAQLAPTGFACSGLPGPVCLARPGLLGATQPVPIWFHQLRSAGLGLLSSAQPAQSGLPCSAGQAVPIRPQPARPTEPGPNAPTTIPPRSPSPASNRTTRTSELPRRGGHLAHSA